MQPNYNLTLHIDKPYTVYHGPDAKSTVADTKIKIDETSPNVFFRQKNGIELIK